MKKTGSTIILLGFIFGVCASSIIYAMDLPEFSLTYEIVHGSEEDEIEGTLYPASLKNTYSLRVKEIFLDSLWDALQIKYSWKDYFNNSNDYNYYSFSNEVFWRPVKSVKFGLSGNFKNVSFLEPDANFESKNYLLLGGKLIAAYKILPGLTVDSWLKSNFYIYQVPVKSKGEYSVNFGLSSVLEKLNFGVRYRGVLREPLGNKSEKSASFLNYGTMTVKWKP